MCEDIKGKWSKSELHPDVVHHDVGRCRRRFTIAELEEGLRVAQEKPIFSAYGIEIQKQNGSIHFRYNSSQPWAAISRYPVTGYNADQLEAIAKAMRS